MPRLFNKGKRTIYFGNGEGDKLAPQKQVTVTDEQAANILNSWASEVVNLDDKTSLEEQFKEVVIAPAENPNFISKEAAEKEKAEAVKLAVEAALIEAQQNTKETKTTKK
jgi:hypothetical protein